MLYDKVDHHIYKNHKRYITKVMIDGKYTVKTCRTLEDAVAARDELLRIPTKKEPPTTFYLTKHTNLTPGKNYGKVLFRIKTRESLQKPAMKILPGEDTFTSGIVSSHNDFASAKVALDEAVASAEKTYNDDLKKPKGEKKSVVDNVPKLFASAEMNNAIRQLDVVKVKLHDCSGATSYLIKPASSR